MKHPLLDRSIVRAVEDAAAEHCGRGWTRTGFTDLNHRASHPCGIFVAAPFSVFAKLDGSAEGPQRVAAEIAGLSPRHGRLGKRFLFRGRPVYLSEDRGVSAKGTR